MFFNSPDVIKGYLKADDIFDLIEYYLSVKETIEIL